MFAGSHRIQNHLLGRLIAPDQFDHDVDCRIGEDLLRIGGQHSGGQADASITLDIKIRNSNELHRHTDAALDQSGVPQENLGDAAPNRAESNEANPHTRLHSSAPSSLRDLRIPRTACLVRCSFSTSANRTYSSPPSPNPIPGETATFASRNNSFENSSDP